MANNTVLTNQYSSLGVTFSGLYANNSYGVYPNIVTNAATNFEGGGLNIVNPFTISFAQSQSQAAFALATAPVTSTFEALLNGSVVDSFLSATSTNITNDFYGFTGVTFDAIRVTVGGSGSGAVIDNLQFNSAAAQSVPEPFTIIGTLVGGTAAVRMKKKLKSANKG